MTEPIEQKLLRLAEAATPGPWGVFAMNVIAFRDPPPNDHVAFCSGIGEEAWRADAAFIAALDPSTVSRLARVVEVAREHARLDEEMDPCDGNPCSLRAALSTLDATPEGGK